MNMKKKEGKKSLYSVLLQKRILSEKNTGGIPWKKIDTQKNLDIGQKKKVIESGKD